MPKINVYLPDALAEAVKDAHLPVSAVCQHALVQALQRVTALREEPRAARADVPPFLHLALPSTPPLADALTRAAAVAGEGGTVGTEHLLWGVIDEGQNLAVHVLEVMGIDVPAVRVELEHAAQARSGDRSVNRLDAPATNAMRGTQEIAGRMGHNYVGCEHLLLAVVDQPHGAGGRALRRAGVGPVVARRTVAAALAGLVHGVGTGVAGARDSAKLDAIIDRLGRLEALVTGR
ncbi:MAG TPA: Clp protease N-terminal domain-containing protein [Acidimicrobiales bacterium]|nr:Clp protease N-terminal domain-containing protein [Acidimicrobiales bacterium]